VYLREPLIWGRRSSFVNVTIVFFNLHAVFFKIIYSTRGGLSTAFQFSETRELENQLFFAISCTEF
jgi:hypothetical protein